MPTLQLSLKNRILLSFFSIIIVSGGLITIIMQLNEQHLQIQQTHLLQLQGKTASDQIEEQIRSLQRTAQTLADNLSSQPINKQSQTLSRIANISLQNNPTILNFILVNPNGQYISRLSQSGQEKAIGIEPDSRAFKQAQNGQPAIARPIKYDQGYLLKLYTPIKDEQGRVTSIIRTETDFSALTTLAARVSSNSHGRLFIINTSGQTIFEPPHTSIDPQRMLDLPIVQQALNRTQQDQNPLYVNQFNTPVIASSTYNPSLNWLLIVEKDQSLAFEDIILTNNILLAGLAISTIILVAIAYLLSNTIARPLTQLTTMVNKIQSGRIKKAKIFNTGDELQELSTAFTSLTEQLAQRQSSLQETNANLSLERDRHSTLLQSLASGVFAVDQHGVVTLFNKAAESITGLPAQSITGRPVDAALQFFHHDRQVSIDDYSNQSTRYKNRLRNVGLEFHTDDGQLQLSMSVAPISSDDQQGNGWIVSFQDITQERELEAMKLDFVSMAAHELRTPLTALRGYLSILEYESLHKLNQEEQKYLERSVISSGQLSSLVENLLNLSRIERGSLKLDLAPLNVEEMIEGALGNLQEIAKQQGVTVDFIHPSRPLPLVMADNFRLAEVLNNLATNAIRYSKPQNGWVKISVHQNGHNVEISVSDNGQGIPSSSIPRMFTKFYRVQSNLAMGSKGTGLGLFISKAIIDAHKGRIWVESEVGKGSTFTFSVPVAPKGAKALIFGRPH